MNKRQLKKQLKKNGLYQSTFKSFVMQLTKDISKVFGIPARLLTKPIPNLSYIHRIKKISTLKLI